MGDLSMSCNSIFKINRELDLKRNQIVRKIKKQCLSKYPKDENKKNGKIELILRMYEDYIFDLSRLDISKIGADNE
tara:strand:+ start:13081 stop:13308 length:228 start_codon:yes stop_codon:yes gene_type:complete